MARVKNNLFTKGISGMVGKTMVFRNSGSKTYVSAAPVLTEREPSEEQTAQRQRFQQAVIYAKSAISDDLLKEAYNKEAEKKHKHSAFTAAVADFFNAPNIHLVDISGYTGVKGSVILVKITDDFRVERVSIEISHADGTIVESGDAQQSNDGIIWIYAATVDNLQVEQTRIVVKAFDVPGNVSEVEKSMIINY